MNPNQAYYSSNNGGPNRGRRMLFIFGGIFLALLLVVAVVVSLKSDKKKGNTSGDTTETTSKSGGSGETLSLTHLGTFAFVSPSNMKGYVKGTNFEDNISDYTTLNNGCGLQFGVVGASLLPGDSIEEAAAAVLGTTADTGAVTKDPVDKGNLTLENNKTNDKYTLPTIEIGYVRNNVNYLARFSMVTIKGNKRAYVRTYCSNENGSVSSSEFNKINAKAKEIKITTDVEQ
jgi:hypothetical protein